LPAISRATLPSAGCLADFLSSPRVLLRAWPGARECNRLGLGHKQDEDGEEEMDEGIEDETEEEFDGDQTEPEY
jgi:hypothetical protein